MSRTLSTLPERCIYLEEPIHRRAKILAARKGVNLKEVTRDAFLMYLDREEARAK